MSINYVSLRQKQWIWSQKNLLQPSSWKADTKATKKKARVIDGGSITSESSFFFKKKFRNIIYRGKVKQISPLIHVKTI